MDQYENGLLRVGHSSVIHLIDPNPTTPLAPLCKPKGTRGHVAPVSDAIHEPDCKRCRRKAKEANRA